MNCENLAINSNIKNLAINSNINGLSSNPNINIDNIGNENIGNEKYVKSVASFIATTQVIVLMVATFPDPYPVQNIDDFAFRYMITNAFITIPCALIGLFA